MQRLQSVITTPAQYTRHKCDNCDHECTTEELAPITDLAERIEAGGEVPSGECPDCQALCYPIKPQPSGAPLLLVHVHDKNRRRHSDHYDVVINCNDAAIGSAIHETIEPVLREKYTGHMLADLTAAVAKAEEKAKPAGPRFGCPKCKSEAVAEINLVEVLLPVNYWDEDGEPQDFAAWETVGDTVGTKQGYDGLTCFDSALRFHCQDCNEEFNEPERLA